MNLYDDLRVELCARKDFSLGIGNVLICPVCGLPIKHGFDIHEALITRGDVMGSENSEKIFSRYNCVARHHICPEGGHYHHSGHDDWETYKRIVTYLIRHETLPKIYGWLDEIAIFFKSEVIRDAQLKVIRAHMEIINSRIDDYEGPRG